MLMVMMLITWFACLRSAAAGAGLANEGRSRTRAVVDPAAACVNSSDSGGSYRTDNAPVAGATFVTTPTVSGSGLE